MIRPGWSKVFGLVIGDGDGDSDGDSDCDGEFFTSTILSDDPPSGKLRKVSSSVDDD